MTVNGQLQSNAPLNRPRNEVYCGWTNKYTACRARLSFQIGSVQNNSVAAAPTPWGAAKVGLIRLAKGALSIVALHVMI